MVNAEQPTPRAVATQEAELDVALEGVVLDSLKLVVPGLAIVYALLTVSHWFMLPAPLKFTMMAVAGTTALVLGGLYLLLRRQLPPSRWAHPLGAALAGLVLLNSLLHLYLTRDALQITNLLLLLIGIGFLFLSTRWFMLIAGLTLAGWLVATLQGPSSTVSWSQFTFVLIFTAVLSAFIHASRRNSMRRLERLRLEDERRRTELERALLAAQANRRALETTIAVGQSINAILDLDILLNKVAELIQAQYGYYYVGIFLLDSSGDYAVSRAGTGEAGRALCQQGFRLKVGEQGLVGWAVAHRAVVQVNDVLQDPRYVQVESISSTRSELVLPLTVGEELLGALDLQSERVGAFTADDVSVFRALADQVAIAIHNAALYQIEQSRRALSERLYEVTRALSQTLDLTQVLDLILKSLDQLVPYDRASVMLRSGEHLEFAAMRGFPTESQSADLRVSIKENDVFEQICRTRQPLSVPDVSQRPDWQHVAGLRPACSWLGVPLIRSEEVVGMLSLTRVTPHPYSADETTLATAFAGQAALALVNARLYANLDQAYEQLKRLDRTKSDFINVASHELRTPLTLLRGYGQILTNDRRIKSDPALAQMVEGIYTGTLRLHEIIDSMLDMAKVDTKTLELNFKQLAVLPILQWVYQNLSASVAERHLTLILEDLSALPFVEADLDALRKVFYNLVINAIKYTPDGGRITLSGREVVPGYRELPEGGVEIVVSDTGIGVDPQFHDLIFVKFYQTGEVALHSSGKTKFKGGGPGLGLAIAKGIVEAHGGQLWVESPGHDELTCPGSQFHVLLPLRQRKLERKTP